MVPYYLKAVDAGALWAALEAAGIVQVQYESYDEAGMPVGEPMYSWPGYDLDIIGDIYKPTGETDAEGNPVMVKEDGYFANVRNQNGGPLEQDQIDALPLIVPPDHPVRMWAGD